MTPPPRRLPVDPAVLFLPAIALALAATPSPAGPMSLASVDDLLCAEVPAEPTALSAAAESEAPAAAAPVAPRAPDWCVRAGRFDDGPACAPDPADAPWRGGRAESAPKAPVGLLPAPPVLSPSPALPRPGDDGLGPRRGVAPRLDRPPKLRRFS